MTALAAPRVTPQKVVWGSCYLPIESAKKCYHGGMGALKAGELTPGATALSLRGLGRFVVDPEGSYVDNALDGKSIQVEYGIFRWANSASSDLVTVSHIGQLCYIVDDQTVALRQATDTGGTAQVATGTPTAANSTLYMVRIDYDSTGTGVWKSKTIGYVSDGTATDTEICNGLRADLAAIDDLTGVITGTGTTTLILTGAHGVLFEVANIGAGVIAFAATTAGVYVRRSPAGVVEDVDSSGVWVAQAPWIAAYGAT